MFKIGDRTYKETSEVSYQQQLSLFVKVAKALDLYIVPQGGVPPSTLAGAGSQPPQQFDITFNPSGAAPAPFMKALRNAEILAQDLVGMSQHDMFNL